MNKYTFFYLFCITAILLPRIAWSQEESSFDERLKNLEKKQAEIYHTLEEKKRAGLMGKITEKLAIGGLIEVEADFTDTDGSPEKSDIVLATMELGLDAEVNEKVTGHLLFLYEEDEYEDDRFIVDEGTITIKVADGFSVTAGKMYVPFGVFNSHFITDPLTLELGETRESAILATYGNERFEVSIGLFNGDVDETGDDDKIDDIVAGVTVNLAEGMTLGASYISDIADSKAGLGLTTVSDTVGGYSVFYSGSYGTLSVEAEYIAAAGEFTATDVTNSNSTLSGDEPSAFNLELAYHVSDVMELAVKYEGSDDLVDHPEDQYGVAASYGLYENTSLSFEYMNGEFKSGRDRDLLTAQLAVEF